MNVLSLLIACGPKPVLESDNPPPPAQLNEVVLEDGLIEQQIDINGDGTADVFNHYRIREGASRLLVYKKVDLNWDGKPDVQTWFDVTGEIEKEALDGDFDGIAEWVDHYKNSTIVMSEVDTNFDGVYDLFRYYEKQKLKRKEQDTDGDGNIDFWQYFGNDGTVTKTGQDIDGDGEMDIRND